jgi:AcrR family transcriptional regulator
MARSPRQSRKPTPPPADPARRIIDAALALAARGEWRNVGLADVAKEAGLPLLEVYAVYKSKAMILDAFLRQVDAAVLGGAGSEESERPRDRLFDTLMRRLDALAPHKTAIRALARGTASDPLALLCGASGFLRSMAWMLEASGISAAGWRGAARTHLIAAIYLSVLRVWLEDESTDGMKTMATLDRRLRGAASWLGLTGEEAAAA